MRPRLFMVVIWTDQDPITRKVHARSDNKLLRTLGRLHEYIGRNCTITYREAGTTDTRTFDRSAVIRQLGGFREYGCFIGHSFL